MTTTQTIPFLSNFKINTAKIPEYGAFYGSFNIKIDKPLCNILLNSPDELISPIIKTEFRKVYDKIRNGTLGVNYHQNFGLGRFYADDKISLVHSYHTVRKLNIPFINIVVGLILI